MNSDIISLAVANAYEQMLVTDSAWDEYEDDE